MTSTIVLAGASGDLGARIADYTRQMQQMEVRKAAAELRAIWVIGNEYLQAAAQPLEPKWLRK